MAQLLADEDFHSHATSTLIALGHDVLTAQAAGIGGIPDPGVLAFAVSQGRAVLTHNRRHFIRLHKITQPHAGIVVCTRDDADPVGLAGRVDREITSHASLANLLIRVNRPSRPASHTVGSVPCVSHSWPAAMDGTSATCDERRPTPVTLPRYSTFAALPLASARHFPSPLAGEG
jgi:hypothetical protein